MVWTVIPRGQTHSLQVTLYLVSEEWPKVGNSPGQSFLRVDSFPLGNTLFSVGGMAQGKEWSKHFSRENSFSLGYTLFSVGGMAQGEKWSRLRNQIILLPWLRTMGQIAHYWYSILRADILSDLTDVSERLAQMIIIDVIYWGKTFFQTSQMWVKDWSRWLLLMFYTEGRHSFRSHRREWKIGPDDSVFIITLFLCRWRLLWWHTFFQIS